MPVALILAAALAQSAAGATIDLTIPPGANYDKAEFRLWYPPSTERVQATLVLVPGSNGDGRPHGPRTVLARVRRAVNAEPRTRL